MCFRKCQQCQTELNQTEAETHDCSWRLTFRKWQASETVTNGGDPQVLIEYLAAEIDVLRQRMEANW